ncbi:MAG: pyridoxamine 5'-phosphate oxidase family protein [Ilumatobacteraceae bacterium]
MLATNGPDGHPQLTAVWYVVEDDQIYISITESTRKAENLAVDSRCSVLIFHPETLTTTPRSAASRIEPDHDYVFADRLGQRYDTDSTLLRRHRRSAAPGRHRGTKVLVTDVGNVRDGGTRHRHRHHLRLRRDEAT